MHVLAVASQKGGSGKTTLAGHLAVQAELSGNGPVALIDTDPQGSLSEWWNERDAETPAFVHTFVTQLDQDLQRLRDSGMKLVVIDTPPAITSTISYVIKAADFVLIPTRPSPHDLRAAGATVDLAEELGKPILFALNAASPRAKITTEAVIALSQHGAVAPAIIHQRTDYAASMIDGRTVMELPGANRSAEEIAELWDCVRQHIQANVRRAPGSPAGKLDEDVTRARNLAKAAVAGAL